MAKILFIVLPNITYEDFVSPGPNVRHIRKNDGKNYGSLLTDMPLGVISMSGYLKKHIKVDVQLLDFNIALNTDAGFPYDGYGPFFTEELQKITETPEIIGISSLFSPSYYSMLVAAECCKAQFPEAMVLAGGSVPANMYNQIYNEKNGHNIDAICFGEGERPILNLLQASDYKEHVEANSCWVTKAKAQRGESFTHDFIEDLDEIPFYDYDLCPKESYGLNPAITAYAGVRKKQNVFHVMTSRGCPFKCTFCASHVVHGRKMRYYSNARVLEDFKRLISQLDAGTFVFQDDHFMGDKQRAMDIVAMVKELGVTAVFQNGLALYALDREMLEALHDAGVRQLLLSVESGSERVLKEVMRKPLKLSIIQQVADDCRDLGIYTNTNILIGMPGETKEDIEDTRAFLKTVNSNWFLIFCASPLVGSEMYELALEKGYLTDRTLGSDYKKAVIATEDFSAEYIQEMAYIMNLELNFVENSDYRLGNHAEALHGFKSVMRVKEDHVLAYYYAAKCCEKLQEPADQKRYMDLAIQYAKDPYWRKYIDMFKLPL